MARLLTSERLEPGELSGRPLDTTPELLTGLDQLHGAIRNEGYRGAVRLRLQLSATGAVESAEVVDPISLANIPDVLTAARSLRFKPLTKNGQPEPTSLEMLTQVK